MEALNSPRLEFTLADKEYKIFRSSLRCLFKLGGELMICATPNEASDLRCFYFSRIAPITHPSHHQSSCRFNSSRLVRRLVSTRLIYLIRSFTFCEIEAAKSSYSIVPLSTHFIEILGQIFENLGTNPQKFLCLGLLHEILRVVGKPVYFSQGRRCGRWPGITKNDL